MYIKFINAFMTFIKFFNFFKKKEIVEVNPLLIEIDTLRNKINYLETIINDKIGKSPVSINWDAMPNAFSIERLLEIEIDDDGKYIPNKYRCITVIGYILDGSLNKWTLYCDEAQHERLVHEFNEHKNKH